MASSYVKDTIAEDLTLYDDIKKGDTNVPFTLLVVATEAQSEGTQMTFHGMMTSDGLSVTVCVFSSLFSEWEKVKPGMVVTFDGSVSNAVVRIRINAISPPEINGTYTFERGELPESNSDNCTIIALVDFVYERTNAAAPMKLKCFTGMGAEFTVQSFQAQHEKVIENITAGSIIHVCPATYETKVFKEKFTNLIVNCHTSTVIYNAGKPTVDVQESKLVSEIKELRKFKSGTLIKMKVVLLRDVYNGSVTVVDVRDEESVHDEEKDGRLPRVNVIGIPISYVGEAGTVVDLVALVTPSEYVQLTYVSMVRDAEYKDEVHLLAFPRYELLSGSTRNGTNTRNRNSSQTSQVSTAGTSSQSASSQKFAGMSSQSASSQKFVGTPIREPPVKKNSSSS